MILSVLRGIHLNKPISIGPAEADIETRIRSAQLKPISKLLTDWPRLGRSLDRLILMNTEYPSGWKENVVLSSEASSYLMSGRKHLP